MSGAASIASHSSKSRLAAAIDSVADGRPILAMTPRGPLLTQQRVRELAAGEVVAVLLRGRGRGQGGCPGGRSAAESSQLLDNLLKALAVDELHRIVMLLAFATAAVSGQAGDFSFDGIFDALRMAAVVHSRGGGTGFSFSSLRGRGEPIATGELATTRHDTRLDAGHDASHELAMAYLYKNTPLQTNFNVNMTCLLPAAGAEVAVPDRLDLKSLLLHFLDFRLDVVTRRLRHELANLLQRIHILEGFAIVFDNLDEAIRIIRDSDGKADASPKLIARFGLSEAQADAILMMRLHRLTQLERKSLPEMEESIRGDRQQRIRAHAPRDHLVRRPHSQPVAVPRGDARVRLHHRV